MATVSSAWAKPGAWALDSEEQEAVDEIIQQQQEQQRDREDRFLGLSSSESTHQPLADFPSLAAAATTKSSKKKKSQPLSLAEFTSGKQVTHGSGKSSASAAQVKGLTPEEHLLLPTGPRERTAEELERSSSRLGGGFNSYGSGPRRSSNDEPRRFSNDEQPRRNSINNGPSRADEIDDWGASKRSAPPPSFERRERGGFFDSQSRADESDSWVSNKSFVPASEGRRVGSGGFDGIRERRGGFDMFNKDGTNGGADSDSWGKKREEASSGRPRLLLQPRSLSVNNGDSQQGSGKGKGLNPFGEARPREEVLAEKGQDWKKIDEQLESMKIKEVSPSAVSSDGLPSGQKSFGTGNGPASLPEDRTERNWRKAVSVPDDSPRAEKIENGEVADN